MATKNKSKFNINNFNLTQKYDFWEFACEFFFLLLGIHSRYYTEYLLQ